VLTLHAIGSPKKKGTGSKDASKAGRRKKFWGGGLGRYMQEIAGTAKGGALPITRPNVGEGGRSTLVSQMTWGSGR